MDKEKLMKVAFACIKRDLENPDDNCFAFASVTGVVAYLSAAGLIKEITYKRIFDTLYELPDRLIEGNHVGYINASNHILLLIANEGGF